MATTVEMADDSFNEDHFEHIAGLMHVMWDRVPPGGNVTHAVVVKPTVFGVYNMSYARITYRADEKGTSVVRVVCVCVCMRACVCVCVCVSMCVCVWCVISLTYVLFVRL